MNNSIVTQDITDVLDKLQHRISEHSWTLSCKNRIFKLEIKWQDSRAILTNVNTKPPTPHHSAKPTYFDAEPIGLNTGRVDPPTSRLPTIKIKRKSPSKIRRDKARLELWKSRRKTGQTTSNVSSTTIENQQSTGSPSSSTITVPPAVHKSVIKGNTVYCNYSSDSEYDSESDSESVSDSSHTISQPPCYLPFLLLPVLLTLMNALLLARILVHVIIISLYHQLFLSPLRNPSLPS